MMPLSQIFAGDSDQECIHKIMFFAANDILGEREGDSIVRAEIWWMGLCSK